MGSEAHEEHLAENLQIGNLSEDGGLIPRFMFDIFTSLIKRKEDAEAMLLSGKPTDSLIDFNVSASFLEVYGEGMFRCIV